jgi:hypothetical protein
LTKEQQIDVICLFHRSIAAADTYLAIDDKEMRGLFVNAELDF